MTYDTAYTAQYFNYLRCVGTLRATKHKFSAIIVFYQVINIVALLVLISSRKIPPDVLLKLQAFLWWNFLPVCLFDVAYLPPAGIIND